MYSTHQFEIRDDALLQLCVKKLREDFKDDSDLNSLVDSFIDFTKKRWRQLETPMFCDLEKTDPKIAMSLKTETNPCKEVATTMTENSITDEQWREYDFNGRTYRINEPMSLYMRPGGTTHRIVDVVGVVHIVPAPGHFGCIVRVSPKDPTNPVQF